jgi:hypothetical protein
MQQVAHVITVHVDANIPTNFRKKNHTYSHVATKHSHLQAKEQGHYSVYLISDVTTLRDRIWEGSKYIF